MPGNLPGDALARVLQRNMMIAAGLALTQKTALSMTGGASAYRVQTICPLCECFILPCSFYLTTDPPDARRREMGGCQCTDAAVQAGELLTAPGKWDTVTPGSIRK